MLHTASACRARALCPALFVGGSGVTQLVIVEAGAAERRPPPLPARTCRL
jgi:hypothetical protein